MKYLALIFCFTFISLISLYPQDISENPPHNWNSFLYLESGFIYPKGSLRENFPIRQNISSFYVNQTTEGEISSESSGFVVGLIWEYFNTKFKTGVSTGLRYVDYNCEITGYSSSNSDFFYLRYSMKNSDTKFARVKSIVEANNLITIPLEIRYVPIQSDIIGFFLKAGTEISLLNTRKKTTIDFQEGSMDEYQDEVLNSLGVVDKNFYSTAYASIGIKAGHKNKPNYIFEVFLPSVFLTKDNSTLMTVDYFEGFKFSIQFPVKK
jgi:hypothetical protein